MDNDPDDDDIYWVVIDALSDQPNLWAICDRCDVELQIMSTDPTVCDIYQNFITTHIPCKKK